MGDSGRFHLRIPRADRLRLHALAEQAQRSESDVVRLLIRAAEPRHITTGIPLPERPGEAETLAPSERQAA